MPYSVASGAIVEMRLNGSCQGSRVMNTFHWQYISGTTIPDGSASLDDFWTYLSSATHLRGKYQPCVTVAFSFLSLTLQWIYQQRYYPNGYDASTWAGVATGVEEPSVVTATVKWITDKASKRDRGRWYMPGVPNSFVTGANINATGLPAYRALGAEMIKQVTLSSGAVLIPVIYHRDNPGAPTPITKADAGPNVQTQRRRLSGRGI